MSNWPSLDSLPICLERIICQYVWRRYLKHMGSPRRHFSKMNKHCFFIDWEQLHFSHKTSITELDADWDFLQCFSSETQRLRFQDGSRHTDSYVSVNSDVEAPVVLCSTTFENTSDVSKTYKFKLQKDMPVTLSVNFSEYYVLSDATNIEVTLPSEILPMPKVDRLILETFSQAETFEDVCTLDITSGVSLRGRHRAEVMCVAYEEDRVIDFQVATTLHLRNELFPVVIRRTSDNVIVYTCFITDLAEVFKSHVSQNLTIADVTKDDSRTTCHVTLTSRGRCKVSGWKDRQVIVMREPVLNAL